MAAGSLLALIDDIASVLDDVALLTKAATKKTAGVLGDDLALNAQQVTGVAAARELPVVWAVAKGSLLNKVILVPLALLISAFAPWAVTPLLMVGGAFLCYEGVEKLVHKLRRRGDEGAEHQRHVAALADPGADLVALERDKIKGAVRTDFVLSAEIIAITLGTVAAAPFGQQVAVLTGIALLMTVGVYGLVALIVKLDDLGLHLAEAGHAAARALGRGILRAAPWLMKALSVAGTAAMFLVGGGILVHGVPALHHGIEALAAAAAGPAGVFGTALVPLLGNLAVGVLAGAIVLLAVSGVSRLRGRGAEAPASVK
ncbi:MAG: DUF808 domain-containing protein [Burkholderiales bacterium]|nr:DUF808 domain-containing protein [Burkholderiales bacterium]